MLSGSSPLGQAGPLEPLIVSALCAHGSWLRGPLVLAAQENEDIKEAPATRVLVSWYVPWDLAQEGAGGLATKNIRCWGSNGEFEVTPTGE